MSRISWNRIAAATLLTTAVPLAAWHLASSRKPEQTSLPNSGDAALSILSRGVASNSLLEPQKRELREKTDTPASSPNNSQQELRRALADVRGQRDDLQREKQLEAIADSTKKEQFSAVMQLLREPENESIYPDLSVRVLRRWAIQDPRMAAAWILEQPGGLASKKSAVNAVATLWAAQDLNAAWGWVSTLPEEKSREEAFIAIGYETARTSPLDALNFVAKLTPTSARDNLILHAARQWAATAPEDAAAWAGQIEHSPLQQRVLAGIATDWAKTDAEAAANFAVKAIEPGRDQDDAIVGVVQRWVQTDPEKAAAWVIQFPEGGVREGALENLVKLWADKDPARLGHWLNTLGAGVSRDLAVGAYVSKLALVAPASAVRWVENIEDESLRLENMERLGEGWIAKDPVSARAWISNSALPEAAKNRLLAVQGGQN